jgi:hypothetical protein
MCLIFERGEKIEQQRWHMILMFMVKRCCKELYSKTVMISDIAYWRASSSDNEKNNSSMYTTLNEKYMGTFTIGYTHVKSNEKIKRNKIK